MREFNLEQALAGAPVQTRDGRPVTQLVKFDCAHGYCVFGVAEGGPVSGWYESGRCLEWVESNNDIFMAHIKKTGWIARYKFPKDENCCFSNLPYPTEEAAKAIHPDAVGYHEISWEE